MRLKHISSILFLFIFLPLLGSSSYYFFLFPFWGFVATQSCWLKFFLLMAYWRRYSWHPYTYPFPFSSHYFSISSRSISRRSISSTPYSSIASSWSSWPTRSNPLRTTKIEWGSLISSLSWGFRSSSLSLRFSNMLLEFHFPPLDALPYCNIGPYQGDLLLLQNWVHAFVCSIFSFV